MRALIRRLLPSDYASEFEADLGADAGRRLGPEPGRLALHAWYARQVASPTMLALAWKLRTGRMAMGRGPLADEVRSTLAQATKGLLRAPLFTAAAVSSLAFGLGANTAIFSVVNAVLLRPPPYEDSERLVFVWNRLSGFDLERLPLSGIQIRELRGESAVFDDVGGVWATSVTVSNDDGATLASSGTVTPNFFSVLGVSPTLGRTFAEDEGSETIPGIVLSHGFWTERFGADEAALGSTVRLEGRSAVIVGVLPPDFKLVFPPAVGIPERLDVYLAYPWTAASEPQGSRFLRTVARVRPEIDISVADASVRAVASRLRATYAHMAEAGDAFFAVPLRADAVERVRPVLFVLVGGVTVFLLLTSANVASLLLARTAGRERELALRACLGASRGSVLALLATEIALLIVGGTVLGLLLGGWGATWLWGLRPEGIARVDHLSLDPAVVATTMLAAAVAAFVAGLVPVLRYARRDPMHALRSRGGGLRDSLRARQAVTVLEVALSVVLVVGAGLVAQTMGKIGTVDLGFEPLGVLTFRVGLSERRFPSDDQRAQLAEQIRVELEDLPGVRAVGATSHVPLANWANWSGTAAPAETAEVDRDQFHFDHRSVTPRYHEAVGARLVSGRYLRPEDAGGSEPVILVDEAYSDRVFPGGRAVGSRVIATRYVGGDFVPTEALVIGVVESIRDHSPKRASQGQVYWPFAQSARWELTYAIRTGDDPGALADTVRSEVTSVHPDLAVGDFRTLAGYVSDSMGETRFTTVLAGVFAALALALAAVGLYGVISYSTARRTRELGLHLALGARGEDLFVGVVREGLALGVIGVVAGLIGAGLLTRYLDAILFEVDPLEPMVFGGVAVILLAVAGLASAGPAWRASHIDPARSLQVE